MIHSLNNAMNNNYQSNLLQSSLDNQAVSQSPNLSPANSAVDLSSSSNQWRIGSSIIDPPISPLPDLLQSWSPNTSFSVQQPQEVSLNPPAVVLSPVQQGSQSQQNGVYEAQLLALQQSLLNDKPNPIISPIIKPVQISFQQPKLNQSPVLSNLSQLGAPSQPIFSASSSSPSIATISIKPSSGLSSLWSNRSSPVSNDVPSPIGNVPRTPDELAALLRQDQPPPPPLQPQPQQQPVSAQVAVSYPIYSRAVDLSVSLIPLPDDKSVGSFGSEVEDVSAESLLVQPGDAVDIVRDLSAPILLEGSSPSSSSSSNVYKVQVQRVSGEPIGYLPTRIGNWLSLLIPSGRLRLRARRPNRYTPQVLLLIEIYVSKISSEEWNAYNITEKAAWRELALKVGRPLQDIVPARILQPDLDSLLSSASASLVKAGSNIKSSSSNTRSVGSSGSGGVKRSADTDIGSSSKRLKVSNNPPLSSSAAPGFVLKVNLSANSKLPPQLSQSSPLKIGISNSLQSSSLQQQSQSFPVAGSSSSIAESTGSLSDQTERPLIDQLFSDLNQECIQSPSLPFPNHSSFSVSKFAFPLNLRLFSIRVDLKRSTEIQNGDESFFANIEPSPRVKLALRPYQLEGLRWLTAREADQQRSFTLQIPPGWTEHQTEAGKRYYMNDETKQAYWTFPYDSWASNFDRQRSRMPVRVCGGILADDMGMGKTIQILSLIMANTPLGVDSMEEPKKFCPTLIVCPLSVLNQWYSEMTSHVEKGALSVYTYHGPNRKKDPAFLASHDVVLTTYATLAGEFQNSGSNNSKNSLAQVKWFRLVLDEAHTIKDRGTLTAKAACHLEAQRRWAVTGTPIQNKLAEIYSLFVFLRVEPLADQEFWTNAIMKPIRNRDERGLDRLRSALSSILLRRTKDQKVEGSSTEAIVSLPPRVVEVERVQFSESEQLFYDALWSNSKIAFEQMLAHGTVMQNYAHVLELLLRVRQACDHPQLVVDHQRKKQQHETLEEGADSSGVKGRLRSSKKRGDSGELAASGASSASGAGDSVGPKEEMCECSVCYEDVAAATAFATSCNHTICLQCVQDHMLVREDDITQFEESLSGSGAGLSGTGLCPVCKSALDYADDVTPLSLSSAAAAAAKGAAAGGAASPILKHDHDHIDNIKQENTDDASYDDEMEIDSKMDLRRSMAISAPGVDPEEADDGAAAQDIISLRGSNTIGNLRSSNYNPQWTFLAPAENYPSVSEKVEDPVATFMEGKPISVAAAEEPAQGEIKTVTIDSIPKRSIKIQAFISDILRLKNEAPDEKAVVFSQWTTMLDLIETALGEEGIAYGRLDGKMSQRSREEAIAQFKSNPAVKVFLISMKAGGLGLNLVVANHVYLMDPWWNPSTEEQAIDRCHRIGQTRPVAVKRFIIKDSIEERILELQEKKRSLARGALGRKASTLKEMRLEDLRLLFNR